MTTQNNFSLLHRKQIKSKCTQQVYHVGLGLAIANPKYNPRIWDRRSELCQTITIGRREDPVWVESCRDCAPFQWFHVSTVIRKWGIMSLA